MVVVLESNIWNYLYHIDVEGQVNGGKKKRTIYVAGNVDSFSMCCSALDTLSKCLFAGELMMVINFQLYKKRAEFVLWLQMTKWQALEQRSASRLENNEDNLACEGRLD